MTSTRCYNLSSSTTFFTRLTLEFNLQLQVLEHPAGKLTFLLTLHQTQKQMQSEKLPVN